MTERLISEQDPSASVERPASDVEPLRETVLVGAFDIDNPITMEPVPADDPYNERLDELERFYRASERLTDFE